MKMVRFWNWAVDLRIFLPSLLVVFLCGGREVPPPAALPFEPLPINVHHTIFGLVYTSRHSRLSGVTGHGLSVVMGSGHRRCLLLDRLVSPAHIHTDTVYARRDGF